MQEVQAQTDSLPEYGGDVRDLRKLPWLSIDNDDTRDLDQLTVAQPLDPGRTRLQVAVADVDVRVAADSAVDRHAAANTTSVYTAAGVFPMLPERLSTNLTSLHENTERMAMRGRQGRHGRRHGLRHLDLSRGGVQPCQAHLRRGGRTA